MELDLNILIPNPDRGFHLTYRSPKDPALSLFRHGIPSFSHLLIMPTAAKGLGPALTAHQLVDFLNAGSNILLTLSGDRATPSALSSLLLELDIALPPDRTSVVVDHFNYDTISASDRHDVLVLPASSSAKSPFFAVDGPIALPRPVGHVLGNVSPLLAPILRAPSTAYPYNPADEDGPSEDVFATGAQIALTTAFQARNAARLILLASAEALEDKWFSASVAAPGPKQSEKTANRAFARKLTEWAFKETGVLRAGAVRHGLVVSEKGEKHNVATANTSAIGHAYSEIYRIKNHVQYAIELSEWDSSSGRWSPFTLPAGDAVQLEFSMLSPFHRRNLTITTTTPNATVFETDFVLPDQHGIFNFYVEYRRPFYTPVEDKRTVTVRHFAHNEWPRSFAISAAWPWIGGIGVTVIGWVAFVTVWLYSAPAQPKGELKVQVKR